MKSINDLGRLDAAIRDEIRLALSNCLDSGWYILGGNITAFEKEFADYTGSADCISVANGTDALEIGLKALGVKPGDQVVTVANAGFYSSIAILACGADPVYADIDPCSYTMAPASLQTLLNDRIKAVVITHLYGQLADVPAVLDLCRPLGIPVMEDCAQAHGANLGGRKAGSFGDLSCFSFYPTKNLGAMGDGGALCTSNPALAERIRKLRQYGWSSKYNVDLPSGRNSRLDEMQACVLRVKLRHLDGWNEARRAVAIRYNEGIVHPLITRKPDIRGERYVAHLYVIETPGRESLMIRLKEEGIPFDVHYPIPDHRQKVYGDKYKTMKLENTERASGHVLTLPCFPEMTSQEIDAVINAVNGWSDR